MARVLHYRYQVTIRRHWEQSSSSKIAEGICNILSVDPTQAPLVIPNELLGSRRKKSLSLSLSQLQFITVMWVDGSSTDGLFIGSYLLSTECGYHIKSYTLLILTDFDYLGHFYQIIVFDLVKDIVNLPHTQSNEILKGLSKAAMHLLFNKYLRSTCLFCNIWSSVIYFYFFKEIKFLLEISATE